MSVLSVPYWPFVSPSKDGEGVGVFPLEVLMFSCLSCRIKSLDLVCMKELEKKVGKDSREAAFLNKDKELRDCLVFCIL